MSGFAQTKATLDAKAQEYKRTYRKHMTGIVKYYTDGELSKTEYVYSFSTEAGVEE